MSTNRIFESMLKDVPLKDQESFPNVRRLVGAFSVGLKAGNSTTDNICQILFPCYTPAAIWGKVQGRNTCQATANFCPGLAVSCGFCGIISTFSCPVVCPISAVYCGASGFACAVKAEEPEETEEPEEP